jgi:hypothetical protein
MDREEIIRMAREAAFSEPAHPFITWGASDEQLERFAALVAAHEREECAKVCDKWEEALGKYYAKGLTELCASAIRARGRA